MKAKRVNYKIKIIFVAFILIFQSNCSKSDYTESDYYKALVLKKSSKDHLSNIVYNDKSIFYESKNITLYGYLDKNGGITLLNYM